LAASILDGRYKDQKYRLNECGVTNIFYVYEGYPSDNCCLTEKELNNALLKTRAKEKFRVYKTKDINETMKLLNSFHLEIFKKIRCKKARYLTTFDEFN
jgi:crossover junction endonuclease MUS81